MTSLLFNTIADTASHEAVTAETDYTGLQANALQLFGNESSQGRRRLRYADVAGPGPDAEHLMGHHVEKFLMTHC